MVVDWFPVRSSERREAVLVMTRSYRVAQAQNPRHDHMLHVGRVTARSEPTPIAITAMNNGTTLHH